MKYILVLAFGFVSLITIAQNRDSIIVKNNWDNIVDHSNVVFTTAYIQDLIEGNKLPNEEKESFNGELKSILNESTFQNPVDFNELRNLLSSNFKKTSDSLSYKINRLKLKSKNIDTLYAVLSRTATDVKMNSSVLNFTMNELESELEEFVAAIKVNVTNESNNLIQKPILVENAVPQRSKSIFTLTNFLILGILLLVSIFIYTNNKKNNKIRTLRRKLKRKKDNEHFNKISNQYKSKDTRDKDKIRSLEKEVQKLRKELKINKQQSVSTKQPSINKSQPIPSQPIQKQASTLYAGKPNPDKVFSQVSTNIDEQHSVYKLTPYNHNQNEAEFEVIIVSDFMKRQITNSPDDFLYRVCNHENSNQDFQKEIITLKKGRARLKDGQWSVSENDKALIKFR